MFPLSDTHPTNRFPFVNYLIIILSVFVFLLQFSTGDFEGFVYQYAFIPASFNFFEPSSYREVLNSIFMHGGLFHIISNMWFLHIFGDNVEDKLGHFGYLTFYMLAGLAATLTQYFFAPTSTVPMIGASGAVAGIAGSYYVFFKQSRVKTLVVMFVVWTVIELPATFVLGYWFVTQLLAGFGSLASTSPNAGGIAFFAHVGGFIFGYLMAKTLKTKGHLRGVPPNYQ